MNKLSNKEYSLSPAGAAAKWFISAIVLLPLLLVFGIWLYKHEQFVGIPTGLLILVIGLGPLLILLSMLGSHNPKVLLGSNGLRIRVSFIYKTWPLTTLDCKAATILNLDSQDEWNPRWKLFGMAMPGLKSGLFKLKNGKKAHVYITNLQKVVYIPSDTGTILLSMESPTSFLKHLQSL